MRQHIMDTTTSQSVDIDSFLSFVQSFDQSTFASEDDRRRATVATMSLFRRLESPYEAFVRRVWKDVSRKYLRRI
jgi:hypothetical protein